jgi:hypothetical protein
MGAACALHVMSQEGASRRGIEIYETRGSCKTGKPKGMTCEQENQVKSIYKHAPMNVIYIVYMREWE